MPDACNSRSLSWLVKTCIPDDPRREISDQKPEIHHHHHQSTATSISSVPDDHLLECLSRVPNSSLPSLPHVSRRFSLLLDSPAFLRLRRSRGCLRPTLRALAFADPGLLHVAALPIGNPNAVWDLSAVAIPLDGYSSHARVAVLDRWIYIIGGTDTWRFDAWTGTVARRAPTVFPRRKFAAAAIGGKIYVAGGAVRTSAVEEYDPEEDTWRVVAEAPVRRYGCVGASAGGVFHVIGGLRVGGRPDPAARTCAGSMDAYHVGTGSWLRAPRAAEAVPDGGCAVGACGVGPHVYVLASHAAWVSFWRWDWGRGRRGGGGGWTRLEPPPVLCGAVRFSCASVGESKVVALVHTRAVDPAVEGVVLVYDISAGEWSRWPDLPAPLSRAACACVEC